MLTLNSVDEALHGHIDTITREELCDYIDTVLTTAGVDVEALGRSPGAQRQ